MKKLFFLSLLITALSLHAQTTAIPNNDFEQRLIDLGYDDVIDGQVLTANINTITSFEISSGSYNPSNLTGIEDFTALETLIVIGRPALTSLDLSQNVNLISVDLSGNFNLPTINVSNSPNLTFLKLNGTGIAHLNVSSNTNLSDLIVSPNSNLLSLNASNTSITTLDLGVNSNLSSVDVSNTSITVLDLSVNSNLDSIDVSNNTTLTALNLRNGNNINITNYNSSNTPNLTSCIIVDNQNYSTTNWTNRDSANTFCVVVNIPDDNFEQALIDLGYDTAPLDDFIPFENIAFITSLDISSSNISDATGIEFFGNIQELNISNNSLTVLDISNYNLIELNISNNNFTELDVSNNSNLRELIASSNPNLATLNINNINLELLYVQSTALTSLDLSAHTNLNNLIVGNSTVLTSLNVQNGNNSTMGAGNFVSLSTPNLSCITVDDPSYSNSTWINVDSANTFSTSCGPANAFNFDGVNDYAVATNPSILDITTGTVEMRVKPETKTTSQTILAYRSSNGGSTKYLFNLLGNLSGIGFWNGSIYQTITYAFNAGEWYNISITDDDSGNTTVYVNGASIGAFNSEFGTATGSSLNLYVGVDFPLSEYFKGDIGDIRIWNTVKVGGSLSCNDAPAGTDLLAHFNFNQGFSSSNNSTVNTILDNTSTINNLQLTNVALIGNTSNWVYTESNMLQDTIPPTAIAQDITVALDANGQITVNPTLVDNGSTDNCGDIVSYTLSLDTFTCADATIDNNKAIQFNGVDQHIAIADDASNDISGSYTMSCWVKYDATGPNLQRPVSKPSALDGTGYCIAMNNAGSVALTFIDASSGAPNGLGTGNGVVPADTWTHVAVTYNDTNNTANVFVNGTSVASGVINPTFPNSSQPLFIGTEGIGSSALTFRHFKGDIDEVRIWDVARTETQIANDMNQRIEPQAGLVGLYRFNEGTGTIVNDASGVAPNGSFVNLDAATDWIDGAPAQSLLGQIEVDFTVTDSSGNSDTASATITVQDNEAPTVITQDITVNLICGIPTSITADDIDNESTDACGIENISLDIDTFDGTMVGANTVTLTVTDAFGNSNSGTAIVTVINNNPNKLYVNQTATGNNTGDSWTNAFTSLQIAIDTAVACGTTQEIWVASGTYYPSAYPRNYTIQSSGTIDDRSFTFHLLDGVAMYGGFSGTETTIDERDIVNNTTILSGNVGDVNSNTDNAFHVVTSVEDTAGTILDGFAIRDGNCSSNNFSLVIDNYAMTSYGGAGISVGASTLTLKNIVLSDNLATQGAGLNTFQSTITATNITFINNDASLDGGGLYSRLSNNSTYTNVVFTGNDASRGGAIYNYTSIPIFNNITCYANTGTSGQTVYLRDTNFNANNSIFYEGTSNTFATTGSLGNLTGSNNYIQENPTTYGSPTGYTLLNENPFVDSANPLGIDNIIGTADDGIALSPTSSLINLGDNAFNSSSLDILNNPRIINTTIDIGAYEASSVLFLNPKVYLQGALLNVSGTLMRDDLRVNNYITTTSPYSDGLTIDVNVLNAGGSSGSGLAENDIVDWIWVELRDKNDNTSILESTSALLQRDGDLVSEDGVSELSFLLPFDNYFVVVKHRNHLGIMTSNTIALNQSASIIDFTDTTTPITFGSNAQTTFGIPANTLAMWAGDANGDGRLNYLGAASDVPSIRGQVFNDPNNSIFGGPPVATYLSAGYHLTDVNMDSNSVYSGATSDVLNIRNNIFNNPSNSLFGGPPVATYIFTQQLPEGAN